MAMTPEEFDEAVRPIFNLKAHITRIERELAEAQSERDKALAENVRLRAALRGISTLAYARNGGRTPTAGLYKAFYDNAESALSGGTDDD